MGYNLLPPIHFSHHLKQAMCIRHETHTFCSIMTCTNSLEHSEDLIEVKLKFKSHQVPDVLAFSGEESQC